MILELLLMFLDTIMSIYKKVTTLCQRKLDIAGEVVLITGAGSGIGREMAILCAKEGSRVVLCDVNVAGNEETAKEVRALGGEAFTYELDVTNRQRVYEVAARIKDEVGKVSILINNAGIVSGKQVLEIPDEKIIKTFEVNAISHFWTCKAFLPNMMEDNYGHIVTIASGAGLVGFPRMTDYCASKFAAVGFHESLTRELEQGGYTGISTTVVCPAFISTGMFTGAQAVVQTLEPKAVAKYILDAILTKQKILILPAYISLFMPFKFILPESLYVKILRLLGFMDAMNTFVGRDDESNSNKGS